MEVHHHPHVAKKNFKEYLREFIMIFLAVTLGFFAESIREHFVNKEHEKEYMASFYEDLSTDEVQLPLLINSINRQQLRGADSLLILFKNADTTSRANSIYFFLRSMIRQQGINAFITNRTISQVENSGEMRLIDKQISDSLIDYYKDIYYVAYLQESLFKMKQTLAENLRPVLNGYDYSKLIDSNDAIIYPKEDLHLLSTNRTAINNCVMSISEIKGLSITIRNMIVEIIIKAGNIKNLIIKKHGYKK
ncbi:MAG TPA: hypothetical protein VGI61_03290 [Parafilimonas sp.]